MSSLLLGMVYATLIMELYGIEMRIIRLNDPRLTPKQNNFCQYYLRYFNATKSYQMAYGVKPSTASRAGDRLLNNVEISRHITHLRQHQSTKLFCNRTDILRSLIAMFYADISDYVRFGNHPCVDQNGNHYRRSYLYFKNDKDVDARFIQGITYGRNGSRIILPDKIKIAALLLKYLPNRVNHNVEYDTLVQAFIKGSKRADHNKKH